MLATTVAGYDAKTLLVITAAEQVFVRIATDTPDSLGPGDKEVLLMAFGSVALEHFRAIIMLSRSQVATGTAFALFRPLVETIHDVSLKTRDMLRSLRRAAFGP